MTIDAPKKQDIPALKALWQEAFGDEDAFLDCFFSTAFSPKRCRCVTLSGQLAAALYWFDCSWEGKKLAYIYAVATDKACRGRGLCSALMESTHRQLLENGYVGAALIPGNEGLFSLYEKLGYRSFCPMEQTTVEAAGAPVPLTKLSKKEFLTLRKKLLPENGILQEGVTADFLACFTEFYAAKDCVMCLSTEDSTAYFQEFLGPPQLLPGILAALKLQKGIVRLPGEKMSAMYYSPEEKCPGYLGISLG